MAVSKVAGPHGYPVYHSTFTGVTTSTSIVAAVAGKRIKVWNFSLNLAATGTATFYTDDDETDAVTGTVTVAQGAQWGMSAGDAGCFETTVGEALYLTASQSAAGFVTWSYVDA